MEAGKYIAPSPADALVLQALAAGLDAAVRQGVCDAATAQALAEQAAAKLLAPAPKPKAPIGFAL